MVAEVNLNWIQNARRVFAALYGEEKGLAVCNAVIPGIMGDFRKVLQKAGADVTVSETYRLDDKRGDIRLLGRRAGEDLYLEGLSVAGIPVDLGGEVRL